MANNNVDIILDLIQTPYDLEDGRYREQLIGLVRTVLDDSELVELFRMCMVELSLRMCGDDASDEVLDHALHEILKAAILSIQDGVQNS